MSKDWIVARDEKNSPFLPILAIISIIFYSLFPPYTAAARAEINTNNKDNQENKYILSESYSDQIILIQENSIVGQTDLENAQPMKKMALPVEKTIVAEPSITVTETPADVKERRFVTVTAYSSTVDQTDSSPFISANGTYVHDGMVAANFLKFGTKVRFPSLYGDKVFIVEDRMKSDVKMDIWFPSRQEAKNFGVKRVFVEVLK